MATCTLESLAWARSGDKRQCRQYRCDCPSARSTLPWVWHALDDAAITQAFEPWLKGDIERFYLPGIHAINILLHDALGGGGVASLLNDAQGKSYAQILLALPIDLPQSLLPEATGEEL